MLPDGRYAVARQSGDYRLIWLKTIAGDLGKKDAGLFGKRILYYKTADGWQAFGFLDDDGSLRIHRKFLLAWTPEQLESIRSVFMALIENPQQARELYKVMEKK